jgi:hypothetical protein
VPDRTSELSPPELIEVPTNAAPTEDEESGSSKFSRISLAGFLWTLPVKTTKFSVPLRDAFDDPAFRGPPRRLLQLPNMSIAPPPRLAGCSRTRRRQGNSGYDGVCLTR